MLKKLVQTTTKNYRCLCSKPSTAVATTHKPPSLVEHLEVPIENSPLNPCTEDISHISTYLKPTFNFAAYVNKSETLKQLLKLNVNLYKLEFKKGVPQFILGLDFERDIKNHVMFLHNLSLSTEEIGAFITNFPFFFKEDLDNLEVRINYLKFKKFKDEDIVRIVSKNPLWLSYSTKEIDNKLGFFQNTFSLTGNEVREVATKCPKLITFNQIKVKANLVAIKEEMGFSAEEVKQILVAMPKLFIKHQQPLLESFEYLQNEMQIPPDYILDMPQILTCKAKRLQHRHEFLLMLNRAQYDRTLPNYVPLTAILHSDDSEFATDVAKSSVQTYNAYLKSL